jgi:septum formation protein
VDFTVIPSRVPEERHPGESPEQYALRVAGDKAREVSGGYPGVWVLAADTVVETDGQVLGKPRDTEEAQHMLRHLSGRTHRVKTAFVLLADDGRPFASQVVTSTVTFKPLSEAEIHAYLATGEPFDKAGAYAIQGHGASFIERVEGSYTNVVGLPMDEVLQALRAAALLPYRDPHD